MAYKKRVHPDGSILVGYRPVPGARERFGDVPNDDAFEQFQLLERQHRKQNKEVPNPGTVFPEARARPEGDPDPVTSMTLRKWVGKPTAGKPGEFFTYATKRSGPRWRKAYERNLDSFWKPMADKPMHTATRAAVADLIAGWVVCPACERRAKAKGVELTVAQLAVTEPPFDGICRTEEGDSDHFPEYRRQTLLRKLQTLKATFTGGLRYDKGAICRINPVSLELLPMFEDRPSNDERIRPLSHVQLRDLGHAMPVHLEAAPIVGAYAIQRRSETFGLNRGDIRWPGTGDNGVGALKLRRVYVPDDQGRFYLRSWGKTPTSLDEVMLARPGMEALRRHMDAFRSTPNPAVCSACAAGVGEWGPDSPNEHRGCDFADDAAVFVDLDGERMNPDVYSDLLDKAVIAAGLGEDKIGFRVTSKVLRITGSSLLLELDVPVETIKRMGRWGDTDTFTRYYGRHRDEVLHGVAIKLSDAAEAELGTALDESLPLDVRLQLLQRRAAAAEEELVRLRALVVELGGDPDRKIEPVRVGRDPGVWTREKVAAAVDGASSRVEVLRRLGVVASGKMYTRLEKAAIDFGLTLPPRSANSRAA